MSPSPQSCRRVTREAELPLCAPFESVFPLFGPLREADWAEGWSPEPQGPVPEPMEAGFVFRTRHEPPGPAVWTLTEYAAEGPDSGRAGGSGRTGRIRYAMVAESSHVARIAIDLSAGAEGEGALARVRYDLTSLTGKGERYLDSVTRDRFEGWIDEWKRCIEHYLATGERLESHRVQPAPSVTVERFDG